MVLTAPASLAIPLSQSGPAPAFQAAVEAHCAALAAHVAGPAGVARPVAGPLVEALVVRVPRGDPLPDAFEVVPFTVWDDTPVSDELRVLRESMGS